MICAGVLELVFLVTRSIEPQNLDVLQIMRVLWLGRLFKFQRLKVSHPPMCLVQIAPNMRSFGPVRHTPKGGTPRVAHATHSTRTQHTPKHNTHPPTIHTTQIQHHHTQRPHHHHKHRHASFTSHTPRLYYHAPKTNQQKIAVEKQISPNLRKLLATKSSGHCQKKFVAVMAQKTRTVNTTNANFTSILRNRDYGMIPVRTESFLVS